MRVEIGYEDAIQYQWFLVKDSIQLPDEVPLIWGYDFQRGPIGKASKFRREPDGAITAKLTFFKEEYKQDCKVFLKNNDIEASIYANAVTDERLSELRIVYKATLEAVALCVVVRYPMTKTS